MKFSSRSWFSSASLSAALLCGASAASASEPPQAEADAAQDLQPTLLAVSVNGVATGEPVVLLRADDGTLYAPEEAIRSWRLMPWTPALTHEGVTYYSLNGVAGLEFGLVEATQSLLLTASPALIERTEVSAYAPKATAMTPSGTGAFLNYDVVAQAAAAERSLNGLLETGLFTPAGVAISTFTSRWDKRGADLTRLETSWTRPDAEGMSYLRLGDSISHGGLGAGPVRFAGIQFARDFSTQPGFITIPLPSIAGEAELPSVVEVYVNNMLTQSRDLPPGPFEITNVPVITGGGDIQLVVRDLLGRETLIRDRYYTTRELLRHGLVDYAFEAGFLRQRFGRASFGYGSPMVSFTYRRGISDGFTAEAHGEATPHAQMGGVGASVAIADAGVLNASAAVSHSALGAGTRYELGFESRAARLSYGALAELISDDFVSIGNVDPKRRPPRLTLQAFAGLPFEFGSLGLSYLLRASRTRPDLQLLSATASIQLGKLGTLFLSGRTSLSGPADDAVLATLAIPLGVTTSASVGAELSDNNVLRTSVQKSLPPGEGFGYRAAVEIGDAERFDGRLSYQTSFGTYDLDVSWVDSRTGVRLTASGGIGAMSSEVFAARKLSQSFATVKVGDYEGVRVYADNQQVGTTNSSGVAVIPRLRPYERNAVRIEVADLPIDAQIDETELVVRPYDRSGVALDFAVEPSRGALVSLVREDGTPVPTGGAVRLEGSSEEFVVAPGGEVYLTGLNLTNRGVARWQTGSCAFDVRFPENAEPLPRIGPLQCRENSL